jgi:hypothetical protein
MKPQDTDPYTDPECYGDDWTYDPQGGLGHRLRQGEEMYCGVSIPHEHWGGGQAVIPPCPVCWPAEEAR